MRVKNRTTIRRRLGYVVTGIVYFGLFVTAHHAITWFASVVARPVALICVMLALLLDFSVLHITFPLPTPSLVRFALVLTSSLVMWYAFLLADIEAADWLYILSALLLILLAVVDNIYVNQRKQRRSSAENSP